MNRSKSRIAAIMLSALACSANNASTRALSTAETVLTVVGAFVGATGIYNEVSACVRKKQGKKLNWCTGKFSLYNLFSNSEKKQTLILNEDQKSVIKSMFKNVVNEGDKDKYILHLKEFFNSEMLVSTNKEAQEGLEIFKKFLDGKLEGVFDRPEEGGGGSIIVVSHGEEKFTFYVVTDDNNKLKVIYNARTVLEEK